LLAVARFAGALFVRFAAPALRVAVTFRFALDFRLLPDPGVRLVIAP
jgi:hypothetical protein